jgi:hypothetical protein
LDPDDPVSGAALTAEGNVDAQCPQEGLHPMQTADRALGDVRMLAHGGWE